MTQHPQGWNTEKHSSDEIARRDGDRAARVGLMPHQNPYPHGAPEFGAWRDAYIEAGRRHSPA